MSECLHPESEKNVRQSDHCGHGCRSRDPIRVDLEQARRGRKLDVSNKWNIKEGLPRPHERKAYI